MDARQYSVHCFLMMKTMINFRDFGGYATADGQRFKTGYLYRSGQLDHASRRDLEMLQTLGIQTVIDLRSEKERKHESPLWSGACAVCLPMAFDEIMQAGLMPLLFKRNAETAVFDMIEGVYLHTVDQSCPQLAAIFRLLLVPDTYPLLIHCRAGRDRAGFVSAVIQLALGVETEDVVVEYLRSNAYLLPQARRLLVALKVFSLGLFPTRNLRAVFTSQARYIRAVAGRIEGEYGGIAAYLGRCGVEPSELASLRRLLLDPLE